MPLIADRDRLPASILLSSPLPALVMVSPDTRVTVSLAVLMRPTFSAPAVVTVTLPCSVSRVPMVRLSASARLTSPLAVTLTVLTFRSR